MSSICNVLRYEVLLLKFWGYKIAASLWKRVVMLITEMDDGFCALQGARDMQPSSCSVGDSCPPVQGRTNAHGNHDPLVPYLTPGVFRNRTTNLQLASVFMDFRLLLLSPSTSYRDSSQIFGACRDCTKPSKWGPDLHHHRVSTTSVSAVQSLFTLFCEGAKDSLATHVHHAPRLYPYGCFNLKLTSYSSTQLYCVGKDLRCHGRKCIIWDIINCPLSTSCYTGISINHLKFLNSRLRCFCRNGEHLWFSEDALAAQICTIFAPASALSRG